MAKEKIVMDKKEFMEEHKRLKKVLKSPSKKDDKEEIKRQEKEVKSYQKKGGTSIKEEGDDERSQCDGLSHNCLGYDSYKRRG